MYQYNYISFNLITMNRLDTKTPAVAAAAVEILKKNFLILLQSVLTSAQYLGTRQCFSCSRTRSGYVTNDMREG